MVSYFHEYSLDTSRSLRGNVVHVEALYRSGEDLDLVHIFRSCGLDRYSDNFWLVCLLFRFLF